jgi:hypothetical protein
MLSLCFILAVSLQHIENRGTSIGPRFRLRTRVVSRLRVGSCCADSVRAHRGTSIGPRLGARSSAPGPRQQCPARNADVTIRGDRYASLPSGATMVAPAAAAPPGGKTPNNQVGSQRTRSKSTTSTWRGCAASVTPNGRHHAPLLARSVLPKTTKQSADAKWTSASISHLKR